MVVGEALLEDEREAVEGSVRDRVQDSVEDLVQDGVKLCVCCQVSVSVRVCLRGWVGGAVGVCDRVRVTLIDCVEGMVVVMVQDCEFRGEQEVDGVRVEVEVLVCRAERDVVVDGVHEGAEDFVDDGVAEEVPTKVMVSVMVVDALMCGVFVAVGVEEVVGEHMEDGEGDRVNDLDWDGVRLLVPDWVRV